MVGTGDSRLLAEGFGYLQAICPGGRASGAEGGTRDVGGDLPVPCKPACQLPPWQGHWPCQWGAKAECLLSSFIQTQYPEDPLHPAYLRDVGPPPAGSAMLGLEELEGKGEGGRSGARNAPQAAGEPTQLLRPRSHPSAWRTGLQLHSSPGCLREPAGTIARAGQEKRMASKTQPRARRC